MTYDSEPGYQFLELNLLHFRSTFLLMFFLRKVVVKVLCPDFIPLKTTLPATALRRFKSPGESFEPGLDTILLRLVVEPFSDSIVMVIPDVPDAPSEVVGQTHLA